MFRFNFILLVCSFALIVATPVKECKKGEPLPLSVDIENCEEPPCPAIQGSVAVMDVHFVGIKNNIRNLTAIVHATTIGITVPYELPKEVADVCRNLMYGAMCPIYATEDVVYKFNFYIDESYPQIGVKVQVSLIDDEGDSTSCFIVDIRVRKPGSATNQQALIN